MSGFLHAEDELNKKVFGWSDMSFNLPLPGKSTQVHQNMLGRCRVSL